MWIKLTRLCVAFAILSANKTGLPIVKMFAFQYSILLLYVVAHLIQRVGLMRSPNSPPAAARNKRKRVFARTPRAPAKGCRPLHSCFLRERISPTGIGNRLRPKFLRTHLPS